MSLLFLSSVLVAVVCLFLYKAWAPTATKLPLGPHGWPLIDKLLDLPKELLFLKLDEWSKQYGPFYRISIGLQPAIVLSSAKVAADVLDRMSGVTSERPRLIKAGEFYTRSSSFTFMGRTELWRACRRAVHSSLNLRAVTAFYSLQEEEAAYMTLQLLRYGNGGAQPLALSKHTHRFAGSVIYRALYGGPTIPLDGPDPSERQEELGVLIQRAMLPGNSFVDVVPFLKPVIASLKFFRRESDAWYTSANGEYQKAFGAACNGSAADGPFIAQDLEENGEKYGLSRYNSLWVTGALFMAAQETTHTSLLWLILAMLLHPQVVHTVHEQLDHVVGGRPPSFADREQLPFIEAVIREAMRWRTPTPLGVMHVTSDDFEYQGWVIAKRTLLIDNIWSQNRDEALYANPDIFDPWRFLDHKGQLKESALDTHGDLLTFGHGRRVCPGKDFAINSLWISASYVLWAFRFDNPVGEDGKETHPNPSDYCDQFVALQPAPYKIKLVPRRSDLEERLQNLVGSSV